MPGSGCSALHGVNSNQKKQQQQQQLIADFFYCDIYFTKSCWLSNTCTSLKAIYTQNQRKFNFPPHWRSLRFIVILSKLVLPCFCVSPSQLLDVIRSEMLLSGVPTQNSPSIPSSTRNRNSIRVVAIKWFQ